MTSATPSATNGASACAAGPATPVAAANATRVASAMAPLPTGVTSYRCARLNSMPGGASPSGLLIARSAVTAPSQATATMANRLRIRSSAA